MKYNVKVANPKDFYHEIHRTPHFLQFAKGYEEEELEEALPDAEDYFSW